MANQVSDWQLDCMELKQRGSHILQSGLWSDCSFCVGDQIIKAHRLILAMASPVFATMFYGSMPDTDPVLIEDVEPDTFKALLEYIYTDEVAVSSFDIAYELSYAAKKYMLPHLMQECSTCITSHLSPHNACRVYELAALLDDASLMEKCMQESTPESASSATTPGLETRDQFTRNALGKIRFLTLTAQQFAEDPSVSSLLTAKEHLAVLMNLTSSNSCIPMPNGFSVSRQPRNSAIRRNKTSPAPSMYCTREYTPNPGYYLFGTPNCDVFFSVYRTVTLIGIQVATQLMQSSNGSDTYQENIQLYLRDSLSNLIDSIQFRAHVSYNDLVDIKLPRPRTLEQGQNYTIDLHFRIKGFYPCGKCLMTAIGRHSEPVTIETRIPIIYGTRGNDDILRSFIIQKPETGS